MVFRQIKIDDGEHPEKGLLISKGLFVLFLILAALSSLFAAALFRGLQNNEKQSGQSHTPQISQKETSPTSQATSNNSSKESIPLQETVKIKELLGRQQFSEAIPAIASLSEKYPASAAPATFKIHALIHLGRLNEAEEFISTSLKKFPQDAELLVAAASFYHATNNPVAAEKLLLKALIADPKMVGAMRGLVATYIRASLYSMARDAALSGLRRSPGDTGLVNALADSFRYLEEWENAIERYNEYLLIVPAAGAEIHYHLGTCFRQKKDSTDAAIQSLKKAISINPAFVPALNDMAMLLATLGRTAEAVEYLSPLMQHSNQAAFALDTAGLVFLLAGRLENSREMLEKAHQLEPENQKFIIHLAAFFKKSGDTEKAQKLLQQALDLCHNDKISQQRLTNEFNQYAD